MRRSAAARVNFVNVRGIVFLAADLVVVTEFLTGRDVAGGIDEYAPVFDHRLAVALALVIDETRIVATDARVDHGLLVDDEQERVIVVLVMIFVARIGRGVRHAVAEVLDDPRAFLDVPAGEHASPMHR